MSKKEFTSISGKRIKVDTSRKACNKFGFGPGDRVESRLLCHEKATVIGVAYCWVSEKDELWLSFDKNNGRISMPYYHDTLTKI